MTLKELSLVLCGAVTLYEAAPGADRLSLSLSSEWYRDLYTGMSQEIPEEFLHRGVLLALPGKGKRAGRIEIQLRTENVKGKKGIEKSPG